MSTKIYDAYRVKPEVDVWALLQEIATRGRKNVVRKLQTFFRKHIDEMDTEGPLYQAARKKDLSQSEIFLRADLVHEHVREAAKKSATSQERSTYDLDVSVALLHHSTGYYLRAFCDGYSLLGGSLDFLASHPSLEDFHYQNQADRPASVTEEEWDERARIWNEMIDEAGFFRCPLVLEISNYGLYWRLSPWLDIVRRYKAKPWEFPIREEVFARSLRELKTVRSVTAKPGRIVCTDEKGAVLTIAKCTKSSQKGQWSSTIDGALKRHKTLARAVGRVYDALLEPGMRRRLRQWVKRTEDRLKQSRKKRRASA